MKKNLLLLVFIFLVQFALMPQNKAFDKLSLSQEQKDKVKALMESTQVKKLNLMNDLKIKHLELEKLIYNNDINKEDIKKKLKEISDLEYELRYLKFDQQFSIMSILDEQQKLKYKQFLIMKLSERDKDMKNDHSKKKFEKKSQKDK
jgi:Spy/CpxP family protein refolding chaperone